jgi:hypothetical protein
MNLRPPPTTDMHHVGHGLGVYKTLFSKSVIDVNSNDNSGAF